MALALQVDKHCAFPVTSSPNHMPLPLAALVLRGGLPRTLQGAARGAAGAARGSTSYVERESTAPTLAESS